MFYSATTHGFYCPEIHGADIPDDAVELTQEQYEALLEGQSQGKQIVADAHGSPTLVDRPLNRAALIADRRYQAETAGITVNGMHLPTDRDSQALVTGAALAAVIDSNYRCQWKTAEGFIELDAQQIIAIASAMRAHVQACFDREAKLLAMLEAGTYTDVLLDQGWPA